MKYFIFLSIAALASCPAITGGEHTAVSIPCLTRLSSTDTVINGFLLIPHEFNPFSPGIDARINIPESSIVTLFFTDTLSTDTAWVCNEEQVAPGAYRMSSTYLEFRRKEGYFPVVVHVIIKSVYGRRESSYPIISSFVATRLIP